MKFKQIVILLFFVTFSIYNLCPILVQGHCRSFSVSYPNCSKGCEKEAENTPQRDNCQAGSCCAIGLQLTRPSESHHLSQILQLTFSFISAIPSPSAVSSLYKSTFRPDYPSKNLYDYFPVHHISPRAPPLFLS